MSNPEALKRMPPGEIVVHSPKPVNQERFSNIPYTVVSGFPETPGDITRREEKIEQIRQGKY